MLKYLSFKNIFLVDGIGAIITALLLSQLLARFEPVFGMPKEVLYLLAGIAACFAVYSLSVHFLIKENRKPYLMGIAVANTLYCSATLVLVIYLNQSLTWLGIAYFISEIITVMSLVRVEFLIVNNPKRSLV